MAAPPLSHLDLFSGIGGFALAARWTERIQTAAFCETDPFCQSVLRKHWPSVPIIPDIHDLTPQLLRQHGVSSVDLVTGGFPCQPFSCAGKRRGAADDRHLWPQMLRVIEELRPRWVVGENVAHFARMGLDGCLADLEAAGYSGRAVVLPACALGAPHRRERVFIVAFRADAVAHALGLELELGGAADAIGRETSGGTGAARGGGDAGDRKHEAQPGVGGAAHGLPGGLDRGTVTDALPALEGEGIFRPWDGDWEYDVARTAEEVPCRAARLKSLGNAVVPQVAHAVLRAVLAADGRG